MVTASTSTAGAGTQTGYSNATFNGFPTQLTSNYGAYSDISGDPNGNAVTSFLNANTNIQTVLAANSPIILELETQGAYGSASAGGVQTLTSSVTFTVAAAGLGGNLILGLADPLGAAGFTSFGITVTVDGTQVAAATQTFTKLAAAEAFLYRRRHQPRRAHVGGGAERLHGSDYGDDADGHGGQ